MNCEKKTTARRESWFAICYLIHPDKLEFVGVDSPSYCNIVE